MTTDKINMISVDSKTINSIGYSESKLYVTFNTGKTYQYEAVLQEEFIELMEAKSKGSKLKEIVKYKFFKLIN